MTAAGGAYVYLLRDPDVADPIKSIIYVGKGTGFRGGQHTLDARRELERLKNEADDDATEADLRRKIAMLSDLIKRGQEARIDVLAYADGQTMSDRMAFGIEAALIEVLAMTELGNQVKGHAVRMMPESVFTKANKSRLVTLPAGATAISVSVKGLWGGRDYTGTLIAATEDQVWENARQLWVPMAACEAATVTSLAGTDDPAVLIALAKHPDPKKKNLASASSNSPKRARRAVRKAAAKTGSANRSRSIAAGSSCEPAPTPRSPRRPRCARPSWTTRSWQRTGSPSDVRRTPTTCKDWADGADGMTGRAGPAIGRPYFSAARWSGRGLAGPLRAAPRPYEPQRRHRPIPQGRSRTADGRAAL